MEAGPPALRLGDRGPAVATLRAQLTRVGLMGDADLASQPSGCPLDLFDEPLDRAVRQFQQERGVIVDGRVGPVTSRLLDEARWVLGERTLELETDRPLSGDDVMALQRRLSELGFDIGRVDGVFGASTARGLAEFQRNAGLPADGVAGPGTYQALARLRPMVTGGRAHALREMESIRRAGPRLTGKTVVVDAAHGGADRGRQGNGLAEADVVADLAERVTWRLQETGVLTLSPHQALGRSSAAGNAATPDERARATYANDARADLVVSLHCDGNRSPHARGVATYYYGHDRHGATSPVGETFAGLVQREIVARTGLPDCGTHAKTWDLLRYTRMPAIRLELGYVTSPVDAALLRDPVFRDVVAEAVVVSVQRVYLPEDDDASTGALRLRDLADR